MGGGLQSLGYANEYEYLFKAPNCV